jgi:valyl-tRNA synthetase
VADDQIDPEFGTGALKVTPAHDIVDFEIGRRHNLPVLNTITKEGKLTDVPPPYHGMDRFEARKAIVKQLQEEGYLEKIEDYKHNVGHCYRCKTVIEPFISKQWFVKTQPLAEKALAAVKNGKTKIVPEVWEKTYFEWMNNIRDWCISRQLWWGHRIPAWYCKKCEKTTVVREDLSQCPHCQSKEIEQDPDILDTWFSSALWPFSTLGWPDPTLELKKFYPTSVLVTGFDILFFWVARMMMMGLHFMKEVPFRDVYIHALVRDAEGQKMSKSKGNVIDPLEMIDRYGCDAFRFTLAAFATQGRDIKLSEERIAGYRNFANKIWNAARFIFSYLDENISIKTELEPKELPNQWILSRLNTVIREVRKALDAYHFDDAASTLYQFLWHEYCDWYLEVSKPALSDPSKKEAQETKWVLTQSFETILRLLHPFMPFITEELWQKLSDQEGSVMMASYPKESEIPSNPKAEEQFEWVLKIVSGIRNIRSENNVPPGKPIEAWILSKDHPQIKELESYIVSLAHLKKMVWNPAEEKIPCATQVLDSIEIRIPLTELVNPLEEKKRLDKEIQKLLAEIDRIRKKLANESFVERAPKEVVLKEKEKLEQIQNKKTKLEQNLSQILGLMNPS